MPLHGGLGAVGARRAEAELRVESGRAVVVLEDGDADGLAGLPGLVHQLLMEVTPDAVSLVVGEDGDIGDVDFVRILVDPESAGGLAIDEDEGVAVAGDAAGVAGLLRVELHFQQGAESGMGEDGGELGAPDGAEEREEEGQILRLDEAKNGCGGRHIGLKCPV